MRHSEAALAIPDFPLAFGRLIPPFTSPEIAIHFSHRIGALLVLMMIVWNFVTVVRLYRNSAAIFRPSLFLLLLVCIQITLGAFTVWTKTAVSFATVHLIAGAILLATSVVLTLRSYRLFHPFGTEPHPAWKAAVRPA
jgi:cytochrome c oxidase assembly protein subunit 15